MIGRRRLDTHFLALEQLEDAPDDRGLLDALFRCAHTVKGSAGVFGVPLGFAVMVVVSLLTPPPAPKEQELVEHVRYPRNLHR